MRVSELGEYLANLSGGEELFIEGEDGLLHDFKCVDRPEIFDGFDTLYEGGINFKMID